MASILEIVGNPRLKTSGVIERRNCTQRYTAMSLHFARLANAIGSRLPDALRDESISWSCWRWRPLVSLHTFTVLIEEHQATQPVGSVDAKKVDLHDAPSVSLSVAESEIPDSRGSRQTNPKASTPRPSRLYRLFQE